MDMGIFYVLLITFMWNFWAISRVSSTEQFVTTTQKGDIAVLNVLSTESSKGQNSTDSPKCRIYSTDPETYHKIDYMLKESAKLIEYNFKFANYSENPFIKDVKWNYRFDHWARVTSMHGRTLLALAFNYGILSLNTLNFGKSQMDIELTDDPPFCFGNKTENEKLMSLLEIILRDFNEHDYNYFDQHESACHQVIEKIGDAARFVDQCCQHADDGTVYCTTEIENVWLDIIQGFIVSIKMCVFLFGPLFLPIWLWGGTFDCYTYYIKLVEPLYKRIKFITVNRFTKVDKQKLKRQERAKRILDITMAPKLKKLKRSAAKMPHNNIIYAKISEYELAINYRYCVTENQVPVGVFYAIYRAFFACKIRALKPFQVCCDSNIFGRFRVDKPIPWIAFFRILSRILGIIVIPFPYYIRLLVYYLYEHKELMKREDAMANVGLFKEYGYNLIHHFTPTSGLFIFVYIVYIIFASILAYGSIRSKNKMGEVEKITVGSFRDMSNLSWLSAIGLVFERFVWPFEKFGLIGCFVGLIYWPIAIPIFILVCIVYCLPIIYLTVRVFSHTRAQIEKFEDSVEDSEEKDKDIELGKIPEDVDETDLKLTDRHTRVKRSSTSSALKRLNEKCGNIRGELNLDEISPKVGSDDESSSDDDTDEEDAENKGSKTCKKCLPCCNKRTKGVLYRYLVSFICIITLYAIMLMVAETFGFFIEVLVFTIMGVIVNAGSVLKYVILVILMIIYCYDCFNNVYLQYLKMNKALFKDIRGRIQNLDEVTSLPSSMQVNQGFKPTDEDGPPFYELPDDISDKRNLSWYVNDFVLLVDNDDMPRIPRKLFDEVCQIQVAGAPGPLHKSFLEAAKKLLIIFIFLAFVFLTVMSFGQVHNVSSTNQTLATMAGGFIPFLMRYIFKPTSAAVELGTLSFSGKLSEIIENFFQVWPMHDMPFEVVTEEEYRTKGKKPDEDGEKGEDETEKEKKTSISAAVAAKMMKNNNLMPVKENDEDFDVDILIVVPSKYSRWRHYSSQSNKLVANA